MGVIEQNVHTCILRILDLPMKLREGHIVPGLDHSSLISIKIVQGRVQSYKIGTQVAVCGTWLPESSTHQQPRQRFYCKRNPYSEKSNTVGGRFYTHITLQATKNEMHASNLYGNVSANFQKRQSTIINYVASRATSHLYRLPGLLSLPGLPASCSRFGHVCPD